MNIIQDSFDKIYAKFEVVLFYFILKIIEI